MSESQDITQENNLDRYPSGELLLTVIQNEYNYEDVRKNALETRSGILLTLAAVVLTFIFSNIKMPKIKTPIADYSSLVFYVSYFLVAVLAVTTILISVFYLIKVIFITEYKRFEINDITWETVEKEPDFIASSLTEKYKQIINWNHKVNHNKAVLYRKGTYSLIAAIFFSVVLYGLSLNL
ncbi:hypothetical protein V7157_23440 [Neobacillus drentensis]|uniref:hypothetical protein n=1 Tax=Neobacillus drentensis TaxID=220684 RepID=UPI0030022406